MEEFLRNLELIRLGFKQQTQRFLSRRFYVKKLEKKLSNSLTQLSLGDIDIFRCYSIKTMKPLSRRRHRGYIKALDRGSCQSVYVNNCGGVNGFGSYIS